MDLEGKPDLHFQSKLKIIAILVISLIVIGLIIWTLTSPVPLKAMSNSELENGLFGSSLSSVERNVSDGSGYFTFRFGLAYDSSVANHSATEISVYCGLINQTLTSFFARGVALSLDSSTLLIDGQTFTGADLTSKIESGLQVYSFGIRSISEPAGNHTFGVLLFLSTLDLNYIGSSEGSFISVSLNGTFLFT